MMRNSNQNILYRYMKIIYMVMHFLNFLQKVDSN